MLLRHSTSESIGFICFSFLFIKSFGSFIIFCSSKIHYFRAIWLLSIFIYVRILKKAEILSAFYCSLRFCSLILLLLKLSLLGIHFVVTNIVPNFLLFLFWVCILIGVVSLCSDLWDLKTFLFSMEDWIGPVICRMVPQNLHLSSQSKEERKWTYK